MTSPITATMLYDLVQCPHRVTMDLFGEPEKRDKPNKFVELLWKNSVAYEHKVIKNLEVPFLDLSPYAEDDKEHRTVEAMKKKEPLIYSPRITADGLLGEPCLLRKEGDGYVAGDIKSGSGEEGDRDNKKPKKHYGVKLALYTDILERGNYASSRRPFIWDIHGKEVIYDLEEPQGTRNPKTMWEMYQEVLIQVQNIVAKNQKTDPAYCAACDSCHWNKVCLTSLEESDDLTLLSGLGRAKRDAMVNRIPTISDLAVKDPDEFISGNKTCFERIGSNTLHKFHRRAKLIKTKDARPYLTEPVHLPPFETEIFFDIETDPMHDLCYLHGFVERRGGDTSTEKYIPFFTEAVSGEEEERVFSEAWQYIRDNQPCIIYYYGHHERTTWKKLQSKYSTVCTADDIENLFKPSQSVDLLGVVNKATEWPTRDRTLKTLAGFLGFKWQDKNPSGTASIEWFNDWVETGDDTIKQRILEYNKDDCRATRVLLDGIRNLKVMQS